MSISPCTVIQSSHACWMSSDALTRLSGFRRSMGFSLNDTLDVVLDAAVALTLQAEDQARSRPTAMLLTVRPTWSTERQRNGQNWYIPGSGLQPVRWNTSHQAFGDWGSRVTETGCDLPWMMGTREHPHCSVVRLSEGNRYLPDKAFAPRARWRTEVFTLGRSRPRRCLASKAELHNLRCLALSTGTHDEELYLSSARIGLRGVEALSVMRVIMDEAFVGDQIAHRRITNYLHILAGVINDLKQLLASVRDRCDPTIFDNEIRPWFEGADSDTTRRKWIFDGIELNPTLQEPIELLGSSSTHSTSFSALTTTTTDAPAASLSSTSILPTTSNLSSAPLKPKVPFLTRM
ncbi:hypothetical protein L227DRAFT_617958 [Lentinus tigrinus ALCF2SS1-6]|uniref:Uncharacterized protein n=1 Tax=Lentinus tigrinus ALCF2SS1-6 TaxID=1328759 RepID=A0A5C2RLT3_9APHY|nr:hypothetical protein L227DRAFT_617958 [Lentinus tigrinus ALCF2SS1-6]